MADRYIALQNWLKTSCHIPAFTIASASADASFRRYFRITLPDGATRIVMDAPPDKENCAAFILLADKLAAAGVHTPALYHQDLDNGFLLLEDLGETLMLDQLSEQTVERLYADALSALMTMQSCAPTDDLPEYDEKLLRQEMILFQDWLLDKHLAVTLSEEQQTMLCGVFDLLVESALVQPQVFVHRDYHSRNLLPTPSHSPGVIDFQDAVKGPITYDLVSLLRDCYVSWPAALVDHLAMGYFELCVHSGVLREQHEQNFLYWFDLMGVQRHLKASGIFARLNHRDDKPGYLKDIPRTLSYIVQVAERREAIKPLADLIRDQVLPKLTD